MQHSRLYHICWITVILTAILMAAGGITALCLPAKSYYLFHSILSVRLAPFWCILMLISLIIQATAATILIALIIKDKHRLMRDLIATTVIGLICLVTLYLPFHGTLSDTLTHQVLDEPQCFFFTDNSHSIVIEEQHPRTRSSGSVYLLADNREVSLIGKFTTNDSAKSHGRYQMEWSSDSVAITYPNGMTGIETLVCRYDDIISSS